MLLLLLTFIHGILISLVDTINDSNLFLSYKTILEVLLVLLTLFIFYLNKYLCFFGSALFVIGGGIAGNLFAPHAVKDLIWQILIYISIPFLVYHLIYWKNLYASLSKEEVRAFFYVVMPIIVVSLLFALVEDYFVPEEFGNRKLIDKMGQFIMLSTFLYFLNFSPYFPTLTALGHTNKLILNCYAISWVGYLVSAISILCLYDNIEHKE